MKVHEKYQKIIVENSAKISAIESFLRSISYIIPGRFSDSEFAAEVLYSSLNLLRLFHESAVLRTGMPKGHGISKSAWNAYIGILRQKSRLLDHLLTFLNIAWTVEVPAEMIVHRVLGMASKLRFVVILELLKAVSRLIVFWRGGWRPLLRNYLPDLIQAEGKLPLSDSSEALLAEIRLAGGKEEEGIKNYLRKHRVDAFSLVPELTIRPLTSIRERLQETSHILRPLLYSSLVATSFFRGERSVKWRWTAWSVTLAMDVFAEWPQIMALFGIQDATKDTSKPSPMEKEERHIRLVKLLLYLLREPVYSLGSKPYLESLVAVLGQWRLLRPVVETATSYQKLCEKVEFYTLGS